MKRNLIIIGCMFFLFIVICLLTVDLHRMSEQEVLSQFLEHQLIHARYLADRIKSYFENRSSELQALSSSSSFQSSDRMERRTDIEAYLHQLKKVHVKAVSVLEESGIVADSTDPKSQDLDFGSRDFFLWAKKKENKGKVFVSSFSPNSPPYDFGVFLVTPIYQDASDMKHPKRISKFVGALLLTIDFEEFLSKQLDFLDPKTNLHRVWITDEGGTLLYHSKHKDMVLGNIYQRDKNCAQCHTSFDYVEKILRERQGKVEYEMKNSPSKLASFAPVDSENAPWIVVVNSVRKEVMAFERKNLRGHLTLLGIIVCVLLTGFILLNRDYQRKVKAEEEARHWRERLALEEKIEKSEVLHRTIIETAHDIIWTLDTEGRFISLNKSAEAISGYKLSELAGKHFAPLVHADDLAMLQDRFSKTVQGELQSFEVRVNAKNGSLLTLSVNIAPLYENGKIVCVVGFGRDITEQKKAEEALRESEKQLRHLSSKLLTAQETERRRISRELHDEFGGALTVLKLRCSSIERNLQGDGAGLREACKQNLEHIDQIIEDVGRLSRDLSPSVLEDFGLSVALRRLIDNFVKNYNIKVASDTVDVDHFFPKQSQIMVYRIFQEALTNIGKHAQARNVSVKVRRDEDIISFLIEDDGKGFDVKNGAVKDGSERGLGLATMDERARMLGGSFDLWSKEGKGTRITLTIPIKKGESF